MFSSGRVPGVGSPSFRPISAIASPTPQCACTSITFTCLPAIVVVRRRPCARAGRAANRSQPTNTSPARAAPVPRNALRVVMRKSPFGGAQGIMPTMGRLLWPLGVIVAFVVGWGLAGVTGKTSASRDAAREAEQLRAQVTTLQARLHARDELAAEHVSVAPKGSSAKRAPDATERGVTAAVREERIIQDLRARAGATADRGGARGPATTPTVEAALDRFYRYLEATRGGGGDGRERWGRAREMVEEL